VARTSMAAGTGRGGAGLAGARVPVLQCMTWTKKGGEVLLTTQGRRRRAGRRGRYCGGEDQRRRRFGGAPAANRGAAPESTEGVNLRQGRLSGAGANPKEKKGR
jgi:hypothetical protein